MEIVPNIMSMKTNKTMISNMIGNEFKMVDTRLLISGMEFIILNGRRILITLMAEMLFSSKKVDSQPKMTTMKSSYISLEFNLTYDIPGISEVAVCPHEEAHCNDLQDHFKRVDDQEYTVNVL